MPNSSVETDTGLLVEPLVGLRILRDSQVIKLLFRLFSCISRIKSCFSFVLSVSGSQQIKKGTIEDKLAKGKHRRKLREKHRKIKV